MFSGLGFQGLGCPSQKDSMMSPSPARASGRGPEHSGAWAARVPMHFRASGFYPPCVATGRRLKLHSAVVVVFVSLT